MSLFQASYEYPLPQHRILDSGNTVIAILEDLCKRSKVDQLLNNNLIQAQHRMKFFVDKNRSTRSFAVKDFVNLKL